MHVFINPIGVYSFLVSQSFNYNSFIFLMSLELDHKLFFILIIFLNYGRKKISMTVLYYQELFLTKILNFKCLSSIYRDNHMVFLCITVMNYIRFL